MIKCFLNIILLVCLNGLIAAQETDSVAASGKEKPLAQLRGWIYGANEPQVALVLLDPDSVDKVIPLSESSGGEVSASEIYLPFKPGRRFIEVRSGEKILARSEATLVGNEPSTILAWKNGTRWQIQFFSDAESASDPTTRPLRIINFAGGRETLLSVNGASGTKITSNSVQEVRGPRKICMVRVIVLAQDGGPPAQSSVEVDFVSVPSSYIVVSPDYRGRMRPRIINGGAPADSSENESESPER